MQTNSVACGAATPEEFVRESDYFLHKLEAVRIDMTPEGIVVEKVVRYFSDPRFQKFSIKKEHPIQMGSDNRRADVVLIDSADNADNLVAIAECKRVGVEGQGLDQLRSYLSATDTRFGIFANSTDLDAWDFYENLGRNQVRPMTRSEFEKRVKKDANVINRVLNFFKNMFRPPDKPEDTEGPMDTTPGVKTESESDTPVFRPPENPNGPEGIRETGPVRKPVVSPPPMSGIPDTEGYPPLQSEYRDNPGDPSLNGDPYYSEDNGFSCAVALRGMPEGLPDHIDRIIRDERLAAAYSREQIQAEIDSLEDEIAELEAQKSGYESEIASREEDVATKKVELAGLQVQWHAPVETGPDSSQTVAGTSGESAVDFDSLPQEEISAVSFRQQIEAEVEELIHEKDRLGQQLVQKTEELDRKKEELAGLEVRMEAPTETELNPPSVEGAIPGHSKQQFSVLQLIFASFTTLAVVGLLFYLFIFYSSAGDKAFGSERGSVQEKLNEIVNHAAFFQAWQEPVNLFVITFPFIFLVLAVVTHLCLEERRWRYLAGVLVVTLALDAIIAVKISQNIHENKVSRGLLAEGIEWSLLDINIFAVLLLGFAVSLLLGFGFYWVTELWKSVRPRRNESSEYELQIKAEKNERDVQLATLRTQMDNLHTQIDSLNGDIAGTQQKIDERQVKLEELSRQQTEVDEKTAKLPLNIQLAVLKTEMENLQSEINQFKERRDTVQQEIQKRQTKIDALKERRRIKLVDLNKIEWQVSQFVSGWCRYIAHSKTETDDASAKIERVRQVKNDTLAQYFETLR